MTPRTERLYWGIALALVLATVALIRHHPADTAMDIPSPQSVATVSMFDAEQLSAFTQQTVAHDPFRLDRRPTDMAAAATSTAPQAPVQRGDLKVKGIVGGPPWQAVLAGVPGHEGMVVVHAGDTIAGLRVRRVFDTGVILAGPDSLISLTIQHTWQ